MKPVRPDELETAFVAHDAPTLADVLKHVLAEPGLSARRRRDLASGVRRLAKAIGWPLEQAPADLTWLRPRLNKIAPAAHGISPKRWSNILSDAKAAMTLSGIIEGRPSRPAPLGEEWRVLWDELLAARDSSLAPALGRFVRFLSRLGISPEQVGDEHAAAYRDAIALNELRRSPDDAMRAAVFGWNLAVDRLPCWPRQKLTLQSRSKVYALQAHKFPASFQADLDRFLASMSKPSPLDRDALPRPLRPATVRNRRAQVLRIASALVHSGMPVDAIRDLGVLVKPENAEAALDWLIQEKAGGAKAPGIADLAVVLGLIAKRHVKAPSEVMISLKFFEKNLAVSRAPGLTGKNRQRLRQFQDTETLKRLVGLPKKLARRAQSREPSISAAREMEIAVAVALLLYCPVRRRNLAGLDLDLNIQRFGDGRAALVFAAAEVKNHRPIEFEIPTPLLELIDEHVARFRPLLAPAGSTSLFPRRSRPGPIAEGHLAKKVASCVLRETGIVIHLHLFRHLAAMTWLEANPGSYEALRRLLGHAELSSTLNAYAGFEAGTATRLFAQLIDDLRENE